MKSFKVLFSHPNNREEERFAKMMVASRSNKRISTLFYIPQNGIIKTGKKNPNGKWSLLYFNLIFT
jgi:hypothetical protein